MQTAPAEQVRLPAGEAIATPPSESSGPKGSGLFFFSRSLGVDGRLYKLYDQRLGNLRKFDLPELALALVAQHRGKVIVWREFSHNIVWYRLYSEDERVDVRVRGDDWLKIEPYVKSGAWNTQIAPVEAIGYLHPEREADVALLPRTDQILYQRILDDLTREFPKDYPTSNL